MSIMQSYHGIFILTLVILTVTSAERPIDAFSWYTPIGGMKNLTIYDAKLLDALEKRVEIGNRRLLEMRNQIDTMRKITKTYPSLSNDVLNKRYDDDWMRLANLTRLAISSKFGENFLRFREKLPDKEDFSSVLKALLGLQTMYNLNASDLSEGYVLGKFRGKRISINSCENLLIESCEISTTLCEQWTNVLSDRFDNGEFNKYTKQDGQNLLVHRLGKAVFEEICASSLKEQPGKVLSNHLQCYMWTNYNHPWLILQPVAMEMLSESPVVARFYDVISDENIEFLKSLSIPKLDTALTAKNEKHITVDSVRVTHNCWLPKKNNTVLKRLDRFINSITGLQVARVAEQLQIANYGIAGHYDPHTDQMPNEEEIEIKKSNRKATFMLYLSDVESGGSTAFIHLKLAVKPIKGSAVFWHNLLPSGMSDIRTMHGSCPVVAGDKWVANKWIGETKTEVCKQSEYIGRIHYRPRNTNI